MVFYQCCCKKLVLLNVNWCYWMNIGVPYVEMVFRISKMQFNIVPLNSHWMSHPEGFSDRPFHTISKGSNILIISTKEAAATNNKMLVTIAPKKKESLYFEKWFDVWEFRKNLWVFVEFILRIGYSSSQSVVCRLFYGIHWEYVGNISNDATFTINCIYFYRYKWL